MTTLSTLKERHAFAVGVGAGLSLGLADDPEPIATVVRVALGLDDPMTPGAHTADARGEFGYLALGIVFGTLAGRLARRHYDYDRD
jgi:hypothetical protein